MSEKAILVLNNRMETLGVSELCKSVNLIIEDIRLVSELKCPESYDTLPDHSILIMSVGPSDISFVGDVFLKHYKGGAKTCILLRGDVSREDIEPFERDFNGIISSLSSAEELTGALKLVSNGFRVTNFAVPDTQIPNHVLGDDQRLNSLLSTREMQIGQALAAGLSNKEIALRLRISANTVNAHLASIRNKLDLRNRTEIALWVHDRDNAAAIY